MPISRIKTSGVELDNLEIGGTEAFRAPNGTTAQREGSAKAGDQRFNSTISLMEYYDGNNWKVIDTPPTVVSISPTVIDTDNSTDDITITGSNYQSGATVKAVGQNGSEITASSVTINSQSSITATFPTASFSDAQEPYDIVVRNASGLSGTLDDILDVNASPTWTTGATLSEVAGGDTFSISLVASDPDGDTITYSSSDAPTGSTVASNGTFSGTADEVTADTTKTFNVTATDPDGATANRTFSIVYARPSILVNGTGQFINTGYNIYNEYGYYTIVPEQDMTVFVDMWGAAGGTAGGQSGPTYGCAGGESYGEMSLTAGTTYILMIGEGGRSTPWATGTNPLSAVSFPDGGQNTGGQGYSQGNGGGSTRFGAYTQSGFNLTNSSSDYNNTNAVYYMIAGGGAGGSDYVYGWGGTPGGFGGGTNGGDGGGYYTSGESLAATGKGGSQTAGGDGGDGSQARLGSGSAGSKYQGGNATGSAGGGGYYGGGGAAGYYALGGGGSGFINTSFITNGSMATATAGQSTHWQAPNTNSNKASNEGNGVAPLGTNAQGPQGNHGGFYIIANGYR